MTNFTIVIPKLGESVEEATITKMLVAENDQIEEDTPLFEIATDKVDSEIPSPVDGVVKKILFKEGDIVAVGKTVIIVDTEEELADVVKIDSSKEEVKDSQVKPITANAPQLSIKKSDKFYSPLVRSIAKQEKIPFEELEKIQGTGNDERVTKQDLLNYLDKRGTPNPTVSSLSSQPTPHIPIAKEDQVVPMDRVRKIIAASMVNSKRISPHVTAMVEADVTNIVVWRNKVKDLILKRDNLKLTYLPIFTEAIAKALKDFPMVNSSVDGDNIILKKNINIGIAVALPTGNLIVPVVRNADQKNIFGIANEINTLAAKARTNKLQLNELQGGTFTISNFGSFKNVMGTPIINQPQAAIMAVGTIEKKPAVVATEHGDAIAIRHKMFLSLSYDHRVIDGALGGSFLRKVADYLENFNLEM